MIGQNVVSAGVLLNLIDNLTPEMKKTLLKNKAAFQNMGKQWNTTKISQYDKYLKDIQRSQKLITAGAAMFGAGLGGAFISTKSFASFEKDTRYYQTLLDQITDKNIKWQREVLKLAGTTGASIADINKGIYQSLSAGIPEDDIMNFMTKVTEGSIGGRTSVEDTTNTLTTIMNAYDIPAKNADALLGKLFVTVKKGKIEFSELNSTISDFASTGALGKLDINELLGGVSALTQGAGIAPAEAGTALNRYIMSIVSANDASKDFAKTIGLDFNIGYLQKVGIVGFMNEIMDKTGGSIEAIQKLFPEIRAFKAVAPLVGNANAKFNEYVSDIRNGTGEADKAYKLMSDTTAQELDRMKQNWESLKIVIGEGFAPTVNESLESINKNAMKWIDSGEAGKTGSSVIKSLMGAGATTMGIGAIRMFSQVKGASRIAYSAGLAGSDFTKGGNMQYLAHSLGNALARSHTKDALTGTTSFQTKLLGSTASTATGIAQLLPALGILAAGIIIIQAISTFMTNKWSDKKTARNKNITELRKKYDEETDPKRKKEYEELLKFGEKKRNIEDEKELASLIYANAFMDFNPMSEDFNKRNGSFAAPSKYLEEKGFSELQKQADIYMSEAPQGRAKYLENEYREVLMKYSDNNEELAKVFFGYLVNGNEMLKNELDKMLVLEKTKISKNDDYSGPDRLLRSDTSNIRNQINKDNLKVYVTINQNGDRVESVDTSVSRSQRTYEKRRKTQFMTNPNYELVPK